LEEGKEVEQAILDGAAQIAVPAFVATIALNYYFPYFCRQSIFSQPVAPFN